MTASEWLARVDFSLSSAAALQELSRWGSLKVMCLISFLLSWCSAVEGWFAAAVYLLLSSLLPILLEPAGVVGEASLLMADRNCEFGIWWIRGDEIICVPVCTRLEVVQRRQL